MDCEGLCHRKLPEDEGAGSLTWPLVRASPFPSPQVPTSPRETWPFSSRGRRDAKSPWNCRRGNVYFLVSPDTDHRWTDTECGLTMPSWSPDTQLCLLFSRWWSQNERFPHSSHGSGPRTERHNCHMCPICQAQRPWPSLYQRSDEMTHAWQDLAHVFVFLNHHSYFPVTPTKRGCYCPSAGCASGPHRLGEKQYRGPNKNICLLRD